jgi:hypothetical protein
VNPRHTIILVAAMAAVLVVASDRACAQSPPRPLRVDVISANQLDAQQLERVRAYVEYWCGQLGTEDDPGAVEKARLELSRPLDRLNRPSPAFRFEYSGLVLDAIRGADLVVAPNPHQAVNAILVVTQLGTETALGELLKHCDVNGQPARHIRQRAVIGAKHILQGAESLDIDDRRVTSAVRRLRDAAQREPDGLILRHQFEAMAAVDDPQARQHLVAAMCTVVNELFADAAEGNGPDPRVEPVFVAVFRLRNSFLGLGQQEQRAMGRTVGPCLGQLLDGIRTQWQGAQTDSRAKVMYGRVISSSEEFLKLVHAVVRNGEGLPKAELRAAWDNNDRPKYDADLQLWMTELQQPPYGR